MSWFLQFTAFALLAAQMTLADSSEVHLQLLEVSDFVDPTSFAKGDLDDISITKLLHAFAHKGHLSMDEALFANPNRCLRLQPISTQNKGKFSGQVFSISYNVICMEHSSVIGQSRWENLYILKETKKGKAEIDNLRAVNRSPIGDLRTSPAGAKEAHIAFDDLYFVLRQGSRQRYFSLLRTADGKSLYFYLKRFAQGLKRDSSRELKMFYNVGYALSKFHQRFEEKVLGAYLGRTYIHGDCHAQNIFYDEDTGKVTLIDNESLALGLDKKSSGVNDIVDLYLLHTVKTIAHRYAPNLPTNKEFGIDDEIWHSFIQELFLGYLEAYEISNQIAKSQLFDSFAHEVVKELSAFRPFTTLTNLTDQRKQKRFGLSKRRLGLKEKHVVSLLEAVKLSFLGSS